jgi:hypothetical protein
MQHDISFMQAPLNECAMTGSHAHIGWISYQTENVFSAAAPQGVFILMHTPQKILDV